MGAILTYLPILLALFSFNLGGDKTEKNGTKKEGLTLGTAVIILVAFWYINTTWNENKKQQEAKNVDDPNVLLAQRIRVSVNTWGYDWSIDIDGYDKDALLGIAREIKTKDQFDKIASSYQTQFGEDMVQRIRKEMAEVYSLFVGSLAFNSSPTNPTNSKLLKGERVFAKSSVFAYSAKNSSIKLDTQYFAGDFVGIYQGTDIQSAKTKIIYALVKVYKYLNIDTPLTTEMGYVDKSKLYKQ